jgi:hypothetical protein
LCCNQTPKNISSEHVLSEAVTIGDDGELALHETVKLGLEVHGAHHLVVEEEVCNEIPCLLHRLVFSHDDLEDIARDGTVEPRPDDVVLAGLVSGGGDSVDMGDVFILAEEGTDEHAPLGEVGGSEVESMGHESGRSLHSRLGKRRRVGRQRQGI